MKTYIAFDTGHKERGKLTDNYSELKELLEANDFVCQEFFETSITQESLQGFDILVFACPDFAKVSRNEMLEIENWVKEDGGGLLLLSHAGGDKGRSSNLSDLSEIFGIVFENDQVLDTQNNMGLENLPIITNFTPPHPITSGMNIICYRAGCSLSIIGAAIPIAISNETSDPFSSPLICVSEPENGRVCCTGSYEMFRDKIGGGIKYETHNDLALNMFSWLVSEYRIDLKSSDQYEPPEIETSEFSSDMDLESTLREKIIGEPITTSLETKIKISDKSDLMNLLYDYLDQINHMKSTIEALIKTAAKSDDAIIETREENTEVSVAESVKEEIKEPLFSEEDFESLKGKKENKSSKEEKDEEVEEENEITEEIIEEEKEVEEDREDEKEEDIPDIEERREELEAEIGSLEKKLKSVLNLLEFIEKNYKSGKMDQKTYQKQRKKLNKEIQKIKKRIERITSALEEH